MDITNISTLVALVAALSIASERLVEIVKGYFPSLNQSNPDPIKEYRRRSAIQFIAVAAGIITAFLAAPALPENTIPNNWTAKFALGLLASGGSGFWNSIQGYVSQAKEVKKAEAQQKQVVLVETEWKHPASP